MRNLPKSVLEVKSNRECLAYAALEYNENALHRDPTDAKPYKYKWKDIDCKTKAPFICQYNPGISSLVPIPLAAVYSYWIKN